VLACVDVSYGRARAWAACVLFARWTDAQAASSRVRVTAEVLPYQSGAFYRRELPCLLAVLEGLQPSLETVIVDGFVWLGENRAGLGAHLFEALGRRIPIVGVAKTAFAGAEGTAAPLCRGRSQRPLWISAAGLPLEEAVAGVRAMHGKDRLPVLLKTADRLCRAASQGETA
jgi:deoxyribonuclease V